MGKAYFGGQVLPPHNPTNTSFMDGHLFFSRADSEGRAIRRRAAAGELLQLAEGIYTSKVGSDPATVVRQSWLQITGHLFPGAVLSHRSAFDGGPRDGRLYITRPGRRRSIALPGLEIEVIPGHAPIEDERFRDRQLQELFLASEPRRYLDNLMRTRGWVERSLPDSDLEAKLETLIKVQGITGLNRLRDHCRTLATLTGQEDASKRLDEIADAFQGIRPMPLVTRQARARAAGTPIDLERVTLFERVFEQLNELTFPEAPDTAPQGHLLDCFAFYEAYFSNFIEGTEFTVDEAVQIIYARRAIAARIEDSHDVLATYEAAVTPPYRDKPPEDPHAFMTWLRKIHSQIMARRSAALPGQWKLQANRAGGTEFVAPSLVEGTLLEGLSRCRALQQPFARALMTMFVVSEVHPFTDGNGRSARLAMNATLTAAGQSRIIVPTIARGDYLRSLNLLSSAGDVRPFSATMSGLLDWSARLDWSTNIDNTRLHLQTIGAFDPEGILSRMLANDRRQRELAALATTADQTELDEKAGVQEDRSGMPKPS